MPLNRVNYLILMVLTIAQNRRSTFPGTQLSRVAARFGLSIDTDLTDNDTTRLLPSISGTDFPETQLITPETEK
ncbi:MAG: hypothetical protein EA353_13260 [Puniceicoccaceae bacterium]|nr:MAG: hypothetical protein EA353_13260 [Puniceicoccaceae bacterium]